MNLKTYKGKVVNIIGFGRNDFAGEFVESPHGTDWVRIKDPCLVVPESDGSGVRMVKMGGTFDVYEKYVDLPIPRDQHFEIRVFNEDSEFYRAYRREADQEKPSRIVAPGMADVIEIVKRKS